MVLLAHTHGARSHSRRRYGLGRRTLCLRIALFAILLAAACARPQTGATQNTRWIATWEAPPQLTETRNLPPPPGLANSTLRQRLHVSLGGPRARLRLSNEFGDGPLTIAAARMALPAGAGAIQPGSDHALTFGGQAGITIPAGTAATSDAFDYDIAPLSDVVVSLRITVMPAAVTGHPGSRTTSFLQSGDWSAAPQLPSPATTEHWYVISGLEVLAPARARAIAVLGNSITDGRGSGTDRDDRWPDNLSRRLQSDARTRDIAVLNAGIGGNCVVQGGLGPTALQRLDRNVLEQPGGHWLIVLEGVNDIGTAGPGDASARVAQDLIAAYRQIIDRAHARGLRVYGATILPFGGSFYDNPDHEAARQTVNQWIRTSAAWDAVIDLDAVVRDPAAPAHLLASADSGDHLHPGEQGYRMIADAIDLGLFVD